jgi:hypothetical protein
MRSWSVQARTLWIIIAVCRVGEGLEIITNQKKKRRDGGDCVGDCQSACYYCEPLKVPVTDVRVTANGGGHPYAVGMAITIVSFPCILQHSYSPASIFHLLFLSFLNRIPCLLKCETVDLRLDRVTLLGVGLAYETNSLHFIVVLLC